MTDEPWVPEGLKVRLVVGARVRILPPSAETLPNPCCGYVRKGVHAGSVTTIRAIRHGGGIVCSGCGLSFPRTSESYQVNIKGPRGLFFAIPAIELEPLGDA